MKKNVLFLLPIVAALLVFTCDMGARGLGEGDAKEPTISVQPLAEQTVTVQGLAAGTESITPLQVTASSPDGGELSYQWYAMAVDVDEGEEIVKKDVAISGGTGASYTPADLTERGVYSYYVIVTNTNNGVAGKKTAEIRSEPAVIMVDDTDFAAYPTISRQPVNAQYNLGPNMDVTPLTVAASVDGDGELSYTWYRSLTNTNAGGTVAQGMGVNTASFTPDFFDDPGTYYYYVVVTHTDLTKTNIMNGNTVVVNRQNSQRASNVATIVVTRVQTAVVPRITAQPRDASYFTGGTIAPLTVNNAPVSDGGTVSYQWYSNSSASTSGASVAAGDGAATNTFTPAINTASAGTYFYYAVITNTNDLAANKTATVNSRFVMISVMESPAANPNATVTVNIDDKRQFVRGFGGMSTPWSNAPDDNVRDVETMYNPDWGLGYNMMRIMILPNNTDINVTMQQLLNNELSGDRDRSDYYELVKIVNKYNGYVLASPWSPPAEWKTNNSVVGGGAGPAAELLPQYYQQYADYLAEFCRHMLNQGAPVFAVSIQNEPNFPATYDGCEWSPEEMRDFLKEVGKFTGGISGYGGGQVTQNVLIMNGESANNTGINAAALAEPVSREVIDLLGRHIYGDQTTNLLSNPNMINSDGSRKEVWMTEHNINGGNATSYPNDYTWNYVWKFMNDVDLTIRLNQENAFIWWTQKRFYSMIGDGEYGTVDGAIMPRGHGLSHYAKFAKEMWQVGVSITGTLANGTTAIVANGNNSNVNQSNFGNVDSTSVKITAFESEDGNTISLVMYTPTMYNNVNTSYNMGDVKIQLPAGFTANSAVAMRSNANVKSQWEAVALSADRNSAVVNLPASTILSVRFTK